MTEPTGRPRDDATTPMGLSTLCPQCGVVLDALCTSCGACGAVITGAEPNGERAEKVRQRLQAAIGEAFALGDVLGRGGMGIVFRAREVALDRDVALKVLAFDPLLNPEAYLRFEREAKLAARLDHPNIVPIFAVGQRNSAAFYTMRMVKGGSLEQHIAKGPVPLDQTEAILRDVASALDYAHANGVVHRDIKPANVLLGDSGHALVADFGIARAFDASSGGATSTGTGVVGSPAYMSPEQWRGERVDGRADQYALAVLAFELFTGRRPFRDTSMQELLRKHLAEEPPDIGELRADLPPGVSRAMVRALAKTPGERFATAMAFVEALTRTPGPGAGRASDMTPPRAAARVNPPVRASAPTVRTPRADGVEVTPVASVAATRGVAHRSIWPAAALLLVVGGLIGVVMSQREALTRDASLRAGPAAAPAPLAAISPESLRTVEQAQEAQNAELRQQVADARRIALEAESKLEQFSRAREPKATAVPNTEPTRVAPAHLFVMARGGTPGVLIDGVEAAQTSPAVIEVAPGHHTVGVRGGGNTFFPAQYGVDLAPSDTQQVIFLSRRVAMQESLRRARGIRPRAAQRPPQP